MKQALNIFLLSFIVFLTGCKKEKEEHTTYFKAGKYMKLTSAYDDYPTLSPIADADYKIYKDEVDFSSQSSPLQEGKTGADGVFTYVRESYEPVCVYISKGGLNSLRYAPTGKCSFFSGDATSRKYPVTLSTTPLKLRFIVKNAGVEVENAIVQLYISEEDYTNNYTYIESDRNPDTGVVPPTSAVYTDKDGIADFKDLEPRKYWIRIKKGTMTNQTTKTIELPDSYDVDVVNQQEIGIQ